MPTILVLLASSRVGGNGASLVQWVKETFATLPESREWTLAFYDHLGNTAPLPLGPVVSNELPAKQKKTTGEGSGRAGYGYSNDKDREWSAIVDAADAILIVTPQHNWGYPGELKQSLDHLYHEWKGKPAGIVAYGGHGGTKCAAQLKQVMAGGLDMKVVGKVCITIPRPTIVSEQRVKPDDEFLKRHRPTLVALFYKLFNPPNAVYRYLCV